MFLRIKKKCVAFFFQLILILNLCSPALSENRQSGEVSRVVQTPHDTNTPSTRKINRLIQNTSCIIPLDENIPKN